MISGNCCGVVRIVYAVFLKTNSTRLLAKKLQFFLQAYSNKTNEFDVDYKSNIYIQNKIAP